MERRPAGRHGTLAPTPAKITNVGFVPAIQQSKGGSTCRQDAGDPKKIMALEFIPTVWAARLLVALERALIYGQANVSNRDYEGDIRESGNTVKIASIGDVSIGDYVKNTDID